MKNYTFVSLIVCLCFLIIFIENTVSQECEIYNDTNCENINDFSSYLSMFVMDTTGNQFITLLCNFTIKDKYYYKLYLDSSSIILKYGNRRGDNIFIHVDEKLDLFKEIDLCCKTNFIVPQDQNHTYFDMIIIKNFDKTYYIVPFHSSVYEIRECIYNYSPQLFSIIVSFDIILRKYYPTINNIIKGIPPPKLVNTID